MTQLHGKKARGKTMMNAKKCVGRLGSGIVALSVVTFAAVAANAQTVDIGNANGAAGSTVQFTSTLNGAGDMVVGITQRVDFTVDSTSTVTHVPPNSNNKPDCTFSQEIQDTKHNSSFNYFPAGCDPTATDPSVGCTRINVTVVDLGDNAKTPINDGVIYTCNFAIPGDATMSFNLVNSRSQITKPNNQTVDVTGNSTSGVVTVGGPPPVTNTPTQTVQVPTNTPTVGQPTNTPTVGQPTNTPTKGVATPTRTAVIPTGTPTSTPGGAAPPNDDDGCSCRMSPDGQSPRSAWMVLIPVVGLLVMRRRSRK
jgi:MYXO-CTERM domain-containing protein